MTLSNHVVHTLTTGLLEVSETLQHSMIRTSPYSQNTSMGLPEDTNVTDVVSVTAHVRQNDHERLSVCEVLYHTVKLRVMFYRLGCRLVSILSFLQQK